MNAVSPVADLANPEYWDSLDAEGWAREERLHPFMTRQLKAWVHQYQRRNCGEQRIPGGACPHCKVQP